MKVLLAVPSLQGRAGGMAFSVAAISQGLARRGELVEELTADPQSDNWKSRLQGVSLSGTDLVASFGIWTPFNHAVVTAAAARGIPMVTSPMGMLEAWPLSQKRLKKKLAWHFYQRADLAQSAVVHAASVPEAINLRRLGIGNPIAVIPLPAIFPDASLVRAARMRRTGDKRTALFLSRIHPKKGVLELLEAWSVLRPADWRLVIAGPDDGHEAEVRKVIAAKGLDGSVTLPGPVFGEEKMALYSASDLFVLPTHSENFGLVVVEALAHFCPVITTTGAPWGEVAETGSGWWIGIGVEPLIRALDEAFKLPPAALSAMAERGRRLAEERYAIDPIVDMHLQLYRWVLAGGDLPACLWPSQAAP